ncbi:hypothetical protein [Vibrio parahaemolyticus]|uniref:hypothetical protein n=1 Tax=Vibrio parahaemolyticus TaxID=670 RepID=UPI000471B05E|nr:hypothetical protein [Vibrio parahaemolyticus]EJT3518708.1 hypothetical protein [Vibrio parahaemolyticus]EJX1330390.1 hypothetical protein [Vibrio parahaemolyticus]KJR14925.1 hypothetical protein UF28_14710 [Vibrio parahaemolyticus]MDL2015873.1 hypothetical protein [Vibrio parahaemolyticus]MDL2037364.1 hypothetical protein [Vibrio parahaemolyticus]
MSNLHDLIERRANFSKIMESINLSSSEYEFLELSYLELAGGDFDDEFFKTIALKLQNQPVNVRDNIDDIISDLSS